MRKKVIFSPKNALFDVLQQIRDQKKVKKREKKGFFSKKTVFLKTLFLTSVFFSCFLGVFLVGETRKNVKNRYFSRFFSAIPPYHFWSVKTWRFFVVQPAQNPYCFNAKKKFLTKKTRLWAPNAQPMYLLENK